MHNLKVDFIWRKPRIANTYIPFHSHNFYELVYYTYGSGITTLDKKRYHFSQGSFVLIPPNIPHDEQHLANSEVICLGFSCDKNLSEMIAANDTSHILRIVKDILRETSTQGFDYQNMIYAKLNELYISLRRMQCPKVTGAKNFDHIMNYINENFHEKIVLTTFAEELHISYDYFQHKFKALTGCSPQQYLLNRRLTAAKELLLNSDLSCTEIAYRCGFSTAAQFSMLFKKKHGISPLYFKKGHH